MKKALPLLILLFAFKSFAVAPSPLSLEPIGYGNTLRLTGVIELPRGQKLNAAAPSKVAVYEQNEKGWLLTEEVDLNSFFSLTEMINFRKPVHLNSSTSKIKIEASLYHCPKLGRGVCVIEDFEGVVERSQSKKTMDLRLSLQGRQSP